MWTPSRVAASLPQDHDVGREREMEGDEVAARRLAFCRAFLAFFFAFAWSPGCGPPWEPVRGLPCTEPPGCGLLCGWPPDCGLPAGRGYTSVDVVGTGGPMSVASTSAAFGCAMNSGDSSPRFCAIRGTSVRTESSS